MVLLFFQTIICLFSFNLVYKKFDHLAVTLTIRMTYTIYGMPAYHVNGPYIELENSPAN